MSHHRARQIVQRLAVDQSDIRDDRRHDDEHRHADDHHDIRAERLTALLRYIDEQEAADTIEGAALGRVAFTAERRSDEAIMRSATLNDDLRTTNREVAELRDMIAMLAAMIVEAGVSGCA